MRRKLSVLLLAICTMCMTGCCLAHDWKEADCEHPKTCRACGETEGEALGHDYLDATCILPRTCSVCSATDGEPLGHIWKDATCQSLKTCTVCGYTEGDFADHVWEEATCLRPMLCVVCGITEGTTLNHVWVSASYNSSKYCSRCGMVEGDVLEPAFEKRKYEFTLEKGTTWDYTTIANADGSSVTGTATITNYRKFKSDATHPARDGYEWREATVEFKTSTGVKVMFGYTDTYAGLEDYPYADYITYVDGTKLPVASTQDFDYEWKDEVCISTGSLAVQVPEDYEDLVFYVCNADYANTQRIDPNTKFMEMK